MLPHIELKHPRSILKRVLQFGSDLPKLLLVGIVERACLKTVVREIPGIAECFVNKEDKQPKVRARYFF